MGNAKEQITKAAEHLKQQRDELRVKLHLGRGGEWENGRGGEGERVRVVRGVCECGDGC